VEHWNIIVTGTSEPKANTDITITIYEVFNPLYDASGTAAFKIGHVSSDNTYIA